MPWFALHDPEASVLRQQPDTVNRQSAWAWDTSSNGGIRLRRSGTYRIVLGSQSVQAHRSRLTLMRHPWPADPDPEGGELIPFEMVRGTLDVGDLDSYVVLGTEGDVVNLSLSRVSGSLSPALWVWTPDGQSLAGRRGPDQARIEQVRLPRTGPYWVGCYDASEYGFFAAGTGRGEHTLVLTGSVRRPATPSLFLSHFGQRHQVSWLDREGDWRLEWATSTSADGWEAVASVVQSRGGYRYLDTETSRPAVFYRLARP